MQGKQVQCSFHFVGYKYTGTFDQYATLVAKALKEVKQKASDIPSRTGTTIVLYEPHRGPDHIEGFFYVGVEVAEKPTACPGASEYLFVEGVYASAQGQIKEMASIYDYIGRWIHDSGLTPIWPETLFIEKYEFPIPGGELTLEEYVEVLLPIQEERRS